MKIDTINEQFALDIKSGLLAKPKTISSKYFYDKAGDKIFQSIMNMKEYYLTTSEFEIFSMQKEEILNQIVKAGSSFNLIEFGAGDGYKTKVLMEYFLSRNAEFKYVPIDISKNALDSLENDLETNQPKLQVECLEGEYFTALQRLNKLEGTRKVILFLGSNIGNFTNQQAINFLSKLRENVSHGDQVLIGFDLKKDPRVIQDAYDDSSGITKAFNLNLLSRINRELGADFNIANFDHFPLYDPLTGLTKSYLISKTEQTVQIDRLELNVKFKAWEVIHTEISQKFDMAMINHLAEQAGFNVVHNFFDSKSYYVDSMWTPKN